MKFSPKSTIINYCRKIKDESKKSKEEGRKKDKKSDEILLDRLSYLNVVFGAKPDDELTGHVRKCKCEPFNDFE